MNDPRLDFAMRIQGIAQAGLSYADNPYDRERYGELRQIAAEMLAAATEIPVCKIHNLFCNESGYQTPKVDTRAAVFRDGKILLVHERNGTLGASGRLVRRRSVRRLPYQKGGAGGGRIYRCLRKDHCRSGLAQT